MMKPKFALSHDFLSVHHEYFVGTFASILLCPPTFKCLATLLIHCASVLPVLEKQKLNLRFLRCFSKSSLWRALIEYVIENITQFTKYRLCIRFYFSNFYLRGQGGKFEQFLISTALPNKLQFFPSYMGAGVSQYLFHTSIP